MYFFVPVAGESHRRNIYLYISRRKTANVDAVVSEVRDEA